MALHSKNELAALNRGNTLESPYNLTEREALALLDFLEVEFRPCQDPTAPDGFQCLKPGDFVPWHATTVQDACCVALGYECIEVVTLETPPEGENSECEPVFSKHTSGSVAIHSSQRRKRASR
jgi:hypothetical protein